MPETSALNIPHSPIAALGTITLLVAYVVAAYAATAGIIGNLQHRRKLVTSSVYALYGFFALMMLASALIIYAFVTHDYTIKYVTMYSDTTMPLYYKITAYWGGLDGSLMFWVSVLAAFAAIAVKSNSKRHRDMIGYVVGTIMVVQLFFLSLLIYNKNPFATWLTTPPLDGKGLNPLLQTYWMTIHPPSLYIGFVAATIPFAFGVAALASGRLDDMWLGSVRSWTLVCWFFLSLGLILGGRWAYEELGWGGYWAWDPVENAGLLPWLTTTAFLHSVMIQEQRGMLKAWNLILVTTSFFLTIFGTFMTRSGIVQSVHAFGEDAQLALLFILFMAAILIVAFGLIIYRMPALRSTNTFESLLSREFAFLLNNWILLGCALFVLFATMFPTLTEAVNGERITLGPPFFNKWITPLALILLFLAGAAPLMAWRRTTKDRLWGQFLAPTATMVFTIGFLALVVPVTRVATPIFSDDLKLPVSLINFGFVAFTVTCVFQEYWRGTRVRAKQTGGGTMTSLIGLVLAKRRKYGGYVVHLGVAVMFVGFAGKAYEAMEDYTVSGQGETFQLRDYVFAYKSLDTKDDDYKRSDTAPVTLLDRETVEDGEVPINVSVQILGGEGIDAQLFQAVGRAYVAGLHAAVPGRAKPIPSTVGAGQAGQLSPEQIMQASSAGEADGAVVAVVSAAGDGVEINAYLYSGHSGKLESSISRTIKVNSDLSKSARKVGKSTFEEADFPGVLARLLPARWQFKKFPDEPTTEVDMWNHMKEDVYIILTGFNTDRGVSNFRIYINPLINWVWLGFAILALGCAICLIPGEWVERLSPRRPTRRRRLGENALMILIVIALTVGMVSVAGAQGAEHNEASGHNVGESAAHRYRPRDATFMSAMRGSAVARLKQSDPNLAGDELEKRIAAELEPVVRFTAKLMKDLQCLCGGCARETLLECRCGFAANERKEILELLMVQDDLLSSAGREQARERIISHFEKKQDSKGQPYGQRVRMMPKDEGFNRLSWAVPYIAFAGALALLWGFGRRWARRGRVVVAERVAVAKKADLEEDEDYADILDDELRETD